MSSHRHFDIRVIWDLHKLHGKLVEVTRLDALAMGSVSDMARMYPEHDALLLYSVIYTSLLIFYNFYFSRAEIEAYKMLDPATRVVILKALCDIRVEVLLFIKLMA